MRIEIYQFCLQMLVAVYENIDMNGGSTPLLQDFFVKKIGILYAYDFQTLSLRFYWITFKTKFMSLAALGCCHVTSPRQGVNENL